MKSYIIRISLFMLFSAALLGCEFDNFEEPKSTLEGRIVHQGEPLSLRSRGVELELWQHGYDLFQKIPIYVNQDGVFSAQLFDGDYKLTFIRGNGPWLDQTDSVDVKVRGNKMIDIEVQPYYTLTPPTYSVNGSKMNVDFIVNGVNMEREIEYVAVFMGKTVITDVVRNEGVSNFSGADITKGSSTSLDVDIPAGLGGRSEVFVRVGLKVEGIQELLYTQTEKVKL